MRRGLVISLSLLVWLAGCASAPQSDMPTRAAMPEAIALPPMKAFADTRPVPPTRANRDIARDFLDLAFQLESGRTLTHLSRFEGPISVRVTGNPPPTLVPDLTRLIARLRREAGIDIGSAGRESGPASITIEAVSRDEIRRYLPKAACFVVPNVSSLREYGRLRHSRETSWSDLTERRRIAIFVPGDSAPQEVRDCLHEELAQAIGPLNDLYRLPDSVFNDDNVHTVLTGFDMLVLRAYYAPELHSGMTRPEVAQRLPAILSRLNPDGDRIASRGVSPTPRAWVRTIQTALGPGASEALRRNAARQALAIAQSQGWSDHRLGFSHFALGRLLQLSEPEAAFGHFLTADRIYRRSTDTALHRAHTSAQLAAYAVNQGRGALALELIEPHIVTARQHQNAALLATLMMLKAEALKLEGQTEKAETVRLDSIGWARYGFGADWAVRAKLREIAALSPLRETNG
ncbi:DUF2927 domain-containing protein [Roseovarius amoyensis]|uniref:DUF2927 domain-containing protein n=1 Tax=Roseovarius amoyensis TaxID=2211448 RepID=UPI000DBE348F|nr:DUF2927 domain-containing protein [Roseovarius amoyensis]